MEARKNCRRRDPNLIHHGPDIGAGLLGISRPFRHHFVEIQNRPVLAQADLIKEGRFTPEPFLNVILVVSSHRHDEVGSLDQLPGQLSLDMGGWISAPLAQPDRNPVRHGLRRHMDPGRTDHTRPVGIKSDFKRIFRSHTPENVRRTDKEDRPDLPSRWIIVRPHKTPRLMIDRHAGDHVECQPMSPSASPSGPFHLNGATEQLQTKLLRHVGETIRDYGLIEEGDKIMVCLSGGKDSYALLDFLLVLQRRARIHFDLVAVNLDQQQPGFPAHVLPDYLTKMGVPFHIETQDTYAIVKRLIPEGQKTCSLCSRLRRGILYSVAAKLGATKIALGHHRDDLVETLFLNLFYTGKLKTMPPKLRSRDGKHLVIRPLASVRERDLARYAELRAFPIIPCNLCGSQENLKRKEVKEFLREWEQRSPNCTDSMFTALSNVAPPLLLDRSLFDFQALRISDQADGQEDAWLDE